ncbi:MAG: hypothetical protein ABJZ55_07990, partial [Fuerstiella sp.]
KICRPFGTHRLTLSCYAEVENVGHFDMRGTQRFHTSATKWRHDVAMGVSPWNSNQYHPVSPEGTAGAIRR